MATTEKGSRRGPPRPVGVFGPTAALAAPSTGFFAYAVGDRIGPDLTVLGHLATGRFGHLYQVWSADEWNAFTCKVLAPGRRDSRHAVASLRREARVLRQCHHPNIVRVFGEGRHDGLPFLVLEYLEGPTFAEVLGSRPAGRLELGEALRATIHLGAAIAHLHRRGWLHLDVKPGNLLLREGLPVLVDMDSARPIGAGAPAERIGTGPYMAPEQVDRRPLTEAADVYGLGAFLYEMLTGRWPFESEYGARTGEGSSYPQADGTSPPPPSRFATDLPASLDPIVLRALAPQPSERYGSVPALLRDLHRELSGAQALWPRGVQPTRRVAGA